MSMLSGCAAETAPPIAPTVPAISSREADRLAAEELAAYGEHLEGIFPSIELPDVARERFISPQEYAVVFAACMTGEGFEATANKENTVDYGPIPDAQIEAQSVALYTCMARYPTDPQFLRPMSDEQLAYIYEYNKST
ncbi:MAG: hypothetical protein WBX17_14055, partial [Microbacterium sp.]